MKTPLGCKYSVLHTQKALQPLLSFFCLNLTSVDTKKIAENIQKETGGDLFEIQTVQSYPIEYNATTEQAKKEINSEYKPPLKTKIKNIDQYNVIFIGSPNWWGTIAPAVSSFISENDLTGKTIIPFITHGGGGIQNTLTDLTNQCKGCLINQNIWNSYGSQITGLSEWLKEIIN